MPQADWPLLGTRSTDVLSGQAPLLAAGPPAVEPADRTSDRPPAGRRRLVAPSPSPQRRRRAARPGGARPGRPAGLVGRLGGNGALRMAATGVLVGRRAHPASERETPRWLRHPSGLGELLGVACETVGALQLHRASDALGKHREAIETHLCDRALGLFDLQPTVTLYDLTHTYFAGEASEQPQAQCGHSQERRSDGPLLTLGLLLEASGCVRRSQVCAGHIRAHLTLAGRLEAPAGTLVVVDRGRLHLAPREPLALLGRQSRTAPPVRRRRRRLRAHPSQPNRATALGRCHRPRRSPPLRLLRGAGRAGTGPRRALRHPLRGRPRPVPRRTVTAQRPQAPRPGPATQRVPPSQAHPRRRPLPGPRHRRRDRQPGCRRHLDQTPPGRFEGHPPRRLLPAQQRDRLGRRHVPAHLHHAPRYRSRLPCAPVPTRPATHLLPQAAVRRRPPVPHRRRLAARPAHPNPPAHARQPRRWDHPETPRRRPAACHRHLPPARRPHPARASPPPKPNPSSTPSTTRSAPTRSQAASARPSSGLPPLPAGHTL